jgi:hypothetical protein
MASGWFHAQSAAHVEALGGLCFLSEGAQASAAHDVRDHADLCRLKRL